LAGLDSIRQRLVERGLSCSASLWQRDTYFVVPHGRLKLREMDGAATQLIQYARADAAMARASEYVIAPVAEPRPLLEALARALPVQAVVEKRREVYLWNHTRVHLDDVAGLGRFLELETVVCEQTLQQAHAECCEVQQWLGIQDVPKIRGSYVDL